MKVQQVESVGWWLECPGCGDAHIYDSRWTFNGDRERPTFRPSLLRRVGPMPEGGPDAGKVHVCHSFVTDGKIEFLADCTHELAGQTVDVPDVDGPDLEGSG